MSTFDDVVDAAQSRAVDFGSGYPGARSVLYRRISNRLHQLYAAAARWNPEYFGVSAVGTLASGGASFSTMGDPDASNPVFAPELVSRVEIADKGTSSYANDDEVNVVQLNDAADAALAPRVTIRNLAIKQVGTDLTNVTSLRMFYSRRPYRRGAADGVELIDFPETFEDLLVIDLTKWMVRKSMNPPIAERTAAIATLSEEEAELYSNYEQEVTEFTSAVETGRFARTAGRTRQ